MICEVADRQQLWLAIQLSGKCSNSSEQGTFPCGSFAVEYAGVSPIREQSLVSGFFANMYIEALKHLKPKATS